MAGVSMEPLAERIRALPPDRRLALALRLGQRARRESAARRQPSLVAYLETGSHAVEPGAVRDFLRELLPDVMVPSRVVIVEELPRLPNGKIDRKALEARSLAPEGDGAAAPAPALVFRGRTQRLVAELWKDLLGLDRVGPEDDFFHLGGHSLLATQLVSRLRDLFGGEIELRTVFDHPTLVGLSSAVERAAEGEEPDAPLPAEGARDLSFGQERLRFLDRIEPGNPAYNIAAAARLSGELADPALVRALRRIVGRHEVLRTVYPLENGVPVPRVLGGTPLEIGWLDLRRLPPEAREAELARRAKVEARRPFDLSAGPLLRATLVGLGDREHALLLTMHHIASDGWSLGVLLQEVAHLYRTFRAGRAPRLPDLPLQYRDFAAWQRRRVAGERLERLVAYWSDEAGVAGAGGELPTDRPRPAAQSFRGATRTGRLGGAVAAGVQELSRRAGVTPFMTLLAAFQVLISRYSGQTAVQVGSPVANRTRPELEGLIGFFVNTLVLRADLGHDLAVADLLAATREATLAAYRHQDLPFEKLVETVAPDRDLSRNPLFQVMFALHNTPSPRFDLGELTMDLFPAETGRAMFDLTFELTEEDGGLEYRIEFSTDLFDASTIERLRRHYEVLLEGFSADPSRPVSHVPLLTGAELHQALCEWSQGPALGEGPGTVVERIEEQVDLSPDRTAAIDRDRHLSYGELWRRAGRLAVRLGELGVGPEVRAAVLMPASVSRLAALLAILRAGGAYVPLDPAYPPQRLIYLFEDSAAAVLIAEGDLLEALPPTDRPVVRIEPEEAGAGDEAPAPAADVPRPREESLAYLIYTSGSTGRPKGVEIEHRGAAALVEWSRSVFAPEDLDGVVAATSICFDLSVFEHFVTLARGGTLLLAENLLELAELPHAQRATLVNSVPSVVSELLQRAPLPPTVGTVALAGEALGQPLVERLHEHAGVRRVFNLYGPSEDTTYSTGALVEAGAGRGPTVGRPLTGGRAYLLDPWMQAVPAGVTGQIYLGGAGLARGYSARAARTAESFVPDPFAARPGDRIYATGDLARLLPDGRLDFQGRRDHQVKLRGFRIELGEVEAALASHPRVLEAVAVVHGDAAAGERLVAYVTSREGEPVAAGSLRRHLLQRLPAPMVPSLFVPLDRLPRTPNGKLDRRALPDPGAVRLSTGSIVPPRNETERVLARFWGELLVVEELGVHQSFFDLGGHSLMAGQLLARIAQHFGVELPVRMLFEKTTIANLAQEIEERLASGEAEAPEQAIRHEAGGGRLEDLLAELTGDDPPADPTRGDEE